MGARLIRANILSPLTDVTQLNERLDAVSDLIEDERRYMAVTKALLPLKKIDCDRLVGQLASGQSLEEALESGANNLDPAKESEKKLSQIFALKKWMDTVLIIRSALFGCETKLLQDVLEAVKDPAIEQVAKLVRERLNGDIVSKLESDKRLEMNSKGEPS